MLHTLFHALMNMRISCNLAVQDLISDMRAPANGDVVIICDLIK